MRKKGSYTIEAALLMPLIIGTIVWIIYMAYFTHDRAILQQCACIAALRGSQVRTGDAAAYTEAKECSTQLPHGRLLGAWELEDIVEIDSDSVKVSYEGYMRIPGGLLMQYVLSESRWKAVRESKAYRVEEPLYIRRNKR